MQHLAKSEERKHYSDNTDDFSDSNCDYLSKAVQGAMFKRCSLKTSHLTETESDCDEERTDQAKRQEQISKNSLNWLRKQRNKKAKRKKNEKELQMHRYCPTASNEIFGKRKRSTTMSMQHPDGNSLYYGCNKKTGDCKEKQTCLSAGCADSAMITDDKMNLATTSKMECDGVNLDEISSISDDSNLSDPRFDADDEQSDFYDASLLSLHIQQKKNVHNRSHKPANVKPANPFAVFSSTPPSSSSVLWKNAGSIMKPVH